MELGDCNSIIFHQFAGFNEDESPARYDIIFGERLIGELSDYKFSKGVAVYIKGKQFFKRNTRLTPEMATIIRKKIMLNIINGKI
jgi:uncharacterized protein (DUF779 family)